MEEKRLQELLDSKDLQDLLLKIKENRKEQKQHDRRIQQQIAKVVAAKFTQETVNELESLEKKEVELQSEQINLLGQVVQAKQKRRREYLGDEQKKLGAGFSGFTLSNSAELFAKSVPRDLRSVFIHSGSTTRNALARGRGNNPFLDSSGGDTGDAGENLMDLSSWEIKKDELQIEDVELGHGAFGAVRRGVLRGKPVAVKTITPKWDSNEEVAQVLEDFRNEVAVMSKLLHPNVLLLMGVCIEEDGANSKLIMVTELMPKGSVYELIHPSDPKKKIVFKQRMKFAKDIALGMNWLHLSKPPVLHLDLKTHNVLVDKNWVAKVADFGLSRVKRSDKNKGTIGSPAYMAPEMLSDKPYDEKADVYSYGIVLWELVTGGVPYKDEGFQALDEIFQHVVVKGVRPKIPEQTPPALAKLIQKCLDTDPAKRPTFAKILSKHVLDDVIVDAIISPSNLPARTFWKENFSSHNEVHETVSWKKFITALVKFCGIEFSNTKPLDDQLEVKALKMILVEGRDELVTIEKFSKALEWFGPFKKDRSFADQITEIIRLPGFFGDLASKEAEQAMAGKKPGTYMIRFSSQQPGFYTITTMGDDNQLKHYRIKHKAGLGYVLGDKEYPSLAALIKTHRRDLYLKHAVKDSKYATLIIAHETDVGGAYSELLV